MSKVESLQIRPYARLLTMLGEQLIKNERIALIELIKNSYDADAKWVKVSFVDFGEGYKILPESKIIIEDSGHGMQAKVIKNHWLNPATPEKKIRKKKKATTQSGRVIQGEKGIGRFSVLKLGNKISVVSRAEGKKPEHVLHYDFTAYDNEFLTENGESKELFLEDLTVDYFKRIPAQDIVEKSTMLGVNKISREPHGTRIEISALKGSWSEKKVRDVYHDISQLESIFVESIHKESKKKASDFGVYIYRDDEIQNFQGDYLEKLRNLLENNSVIKIEEGVFDSKKGFFSFIMNGESCSLLLDDPNVKGLKVFRDRFGVGASVLAERNVECGSFRFGFYVFDFDSKAPAKFLLDREDKKIIKGHRIYLYRDGVRVYPYGEPEDDWLRIDAYRGTVSAGHFLSNDQVVGYVNITQEGNPRLKDKTNREGLIEEGDATEDFVALLQTLLAYVRQKPYARYRRDLIEKNVQDLLRAEQVTEELGKLQEAIKGNKKAEEIFAKAKKYYNTEKRYLTQRAETTEELAGVGLSVETASHDIMGIMGKVLANLDGIIHDLLASGAIDEDEMLKELQTIRGGMGFIEAQLKDIQLLFKSSKQRRKSIRIKSIVDKVERIYRRLLKKERIELHVNTVGSPLVAKTTDAVLLQLLLNLFDNATYWLMQVKREVRQIEIVLDGNNGQMIFSDNGPGIDKDDEAYIFDPFYSGKGEEGRGLGLYIARQLLERNDYSIQLASVKSEKIQPGANFVVSFISEE
ncbi:ATP-binding protein [uncultured Pseudodesulfovibrio sp.]|uniref:ATP-binding protein n=1 Tax=uncultured Pseudodesulfovibrio sp. TaxID=2035858 RepID=UPI0029C6D42F|nr:ATP-binding protein [uncultured Pseudodesulfovibrio sp.]